MANKKLIVSWVLSLLAAAAFLMAGSSKLMGDPAGTAMLHEGLGVPLWAIPAIGAVEIAAAILIVIPKTRVYGADALTVVMTGAVLTHLVHLDFPTILVPFALGVLAGSVAWLHRAEAFYYEHLHHAGWAHRAKGHH